MIIGAQIVESCDGRHQFHGRGGTEELSLVHAKQLTVVCEVPYHQSHLGIVQQWVAHHGVQLALHLLRPGQL